jgi:hypothetical protein
MEICFTHHVQDAAFAADLQNLRLDDWMVGWLDV